MARGNNRWILIVLIALLVLFGVYTVWGSQKSNSHEHKKEEIEYLPAPAPAEAEDDIEIIEASEDPAFQVGFGMGPGLYGSGRHTSEMIGN